MRPRGRPPFVKSWPTNGCRPWHADPAHGTFRNARSLSAAERTTLLNWIDAGCPEGNPADLPPPRTFVTGWRIGKPDAIFKLQEVVKIPAQAPQGGIPYQFLVVSEPFAEEKWVTAVECRPRCGPAWCITLPPF